MGGHAFQTVVCQRLPRAKYLDLEKRVLALVRQFFQPELSYIPPYYPEKADFGDIDILVTADVDLSQRVDTTLCSRTSSEAVLCQGQSPIKRQLSKKGPHHLTKVIYEEIPALLESREVVKNGDVVSMEFEGFQVDIILVPEKSFSIQKFFYGNGDFGVLLGIICKLCGLKFGINGLASNVFDPTNPGTHIGKIVFEAYDVKKICDFLGLDLERFRGREWHAAAESTGSNTESGETEAESQTGYRSPDPVFWNEVECFEYLTGCRLFRPDMTSAKAFARKHKRKDVCRFLEYARQKYFPDEEPITSIESSGDDCTSTGNVPETTTTTHAKEMTVNTVAPSTIVANKKESKDESTTARGGEKYNSTSFFEALEFFGKQDEYKNIIDNYQRSKTAKVRFNLNVVHRVIQNNCVTTKTGESNKADDEEATAWEDIQDYLQGKNLGMVMSAIRKQVVDKCRREETFADDVKIMDIFNYWVVKADEDELGVTIIEGFKRACPQYVKDMKS